MLDEITPRMAETILASPEKNCCRLIVAVFILTGIKQESISSYIGDAIIIIKEWSVRDKSLSDLHV